MGVGVQAIRLFLAPFPYLWELLPHAFLLQLVPL